ncbi:hypothetical protein L915_21910, partial [Phytophthora nicotianae]
LIIHRPTRTSLQREPKEAGTSGFGVKLPIRRCLDLGVFASMQSLQHRLPRKSIAALIASVEEAY